MPSCDVRMAIDIIAWFLWYQPCAHDLSAWVSHSDLSETIACGRESVSDNEESAMMNVVRVICGEVHVDQKLFW